MSKRNITRLFMPLAFALAVVFGIWLGNLMSSQDSPNASKKSIPFVNNKESKLEWLLDLIDREYVDSIEKDKIIEEIIPKVLDKLDPHSTYIPAKDIAAVQEDMRGSFSGIGVQFSIHKDTVNVLAVISGGPSERVGLLPGDRIVMVDDSLIAGVGVNNNTVMRLLKGKKGTKVEVGIKRGRNKELLDFTITRGTIPVNSVDASYAIRKGIGYIKVSKFGSRTYNEFLSSLGSLQGQGCKSVIVDMRGNQGGYLQIVAQMVNEFLGKNELIVYTQGRAYPKYDYRANGNGAFKKMRIVVLIDDWSASASEIFAGAIQDNDRGVVIGRRSFGKGLVQSEKEYEDGSAFRITISRYYTPSGRCIQKPYENGNSTKYHEDIWNRYLNGEMYEKDSIHLNMNEVYHTKGGRPVYGGGGIMPDIFIPRDTTGLNDFFVKLSSQGIIYRYAIDYTDKYRSELMKSKTIEELQVFLTNKKMFSKFLATPEVKKLKASKQSIKEASEILEQQLRGYITRNIFEDSAFYVLLNEKDKVVNRALEILTSEEDEYQVILTKKENH